MKRYIFIVLIASLSSCVHKNKLNCYEQALVKFKEKKKYKELMSTAHYQLLNLLSIDSKLVFEDSSYIDSAIIDDAVFFNKGGNKCLLLILQQTSIDFKSDRVRIIQGTYLNNKWNLSTNRMPLVPEIIYTIKKPQKDSIPVNNSFKILSDKGRGFVLDGGQTAFQNCIIDYEYWFGEK